METGVFRSSATALAAACMLGFALPGVAAQNDNIEVSLEQPVDRGFTTGIGIIRGWAAAPAGIDRVELFINEDPDTGEPNQVLGFGGSREGICAGIPAITSYPECTPEARPGFASAFNFNLLSDGEHTFTVRAYDTNGDHNDDSNTFTSRSLGEEFISDDQRIELPAFVIDGLRKHNPGSDPDQSFDIEFVWSTASQRFVMSRITEESPLPFIILNPPTGLAATPDSGNVELTWTSPSGPSQARWIVIERKFDNVAVTTDFEVIGVVRHNATSFTDENVSLSVPLLPGTYTYRVVAALPWTTEESGEVSVDQTQNDLLPDPGLPDPGLGL